MTTPVLATLTYGFRGNQVALLLRARPPNEGLWSPPGGKLRPGETPLDGAMREFAEETGLMPHQPRLAAIVSELDVDTGDAWLMHVFRVEAPDGELVSDHDEGVCAWVQVTEIPRLAMPPADIVILEQVLHPAGVAFIEIRTARGEIATLAVRRTTADRPPTS